MSNQNREIMKTNTYIAMTLTGVFFGFTTLNAQTVRRMNEDREKNRTETVQRKAPQKTTTVKRSTASRTSTSGRAHQKAVRHNTPQRTQQQAVRQNTPERNTKTSRAATVTRTHKPASVSNRHNPRSDYRAPDKHLHVRPNKFSEKRYYTGHHYHPVYPRKHVKMHIHYDTYQHHYHVLYRPTFHEIYWTRSMYRDYSRWYPNYRWDYRYGYRIHTISVFDAKYRLGEVANVYGRVYATWYNRETDDYLLFFGGDFPNHQFTVVLPGNVARKYSWRPERFFLGEHIMVNGLITTFDGVPEIVVKNKRQLDLY